jgi:hypothetical protein
MASKLGPVAVLRLRATRAMELLLAVQLGARRAARKALFGVASGLIARPIPRQLVIRANSARRGVGLVSYGGATGVALTASVRCGTPDGGLAVPSSAGWLLISVSDRAGLQGMTQNLGAGSGRPLHAS